MASALGGMASYGAEDGRRSVASEMEAIFAPLPRPDAPPSPPSRYAAPAASRRRGRAWLWVLVLALFGLLATAASMVFLARTSRAPLPQTRPRSAISHPAPAFAAPATPRPEPAPERSQPASASDRGEATAPEETRRPKSRSEHRERGARHAASSRKGRCAPGATSAWCLRGAVLQADDRLRDAYESAVSAGVDRETLVGIRSDWKRLRGRAKKDPQALIRGYALLTQELRAEVRRVGGR
jgi:hypothetical protein